MSEATAPPPSAGASTGGDRLDLHDVVDSFNQTHELVKPAISLAQSHLAWAAALILVLITPVHLVFSAAAFVAAAAVVAGRFEWSRKERAREATRRLVITAPGRAGNPEQRHAQRVEASLDELRHILGLLASGLDRLQAALVEVERVRRWVDPAHSQRVVLGLIVAGIVLAAVPVAQTGVNLALLGCLYRTLRGHTFAEPAVTANSTLDGKAASPVGSSHTADGSGGNSVPQSVSRNVSAADNWVVVGGEMMLSASDDSGRGTGGGGDGGAAADANVAPLAPPPGSPLTARIRRSVQQAGEWKRGSGVRCKACNTQVETIFKKKVVCGNCHFVFCGACCPTPRKGKARWCKGCAAT